MGTIGITLAIAAAAVLVGYLIDQAGRTKPGRSIEVEPMCPPVPDDGTFPTPPMMIRPIPCDQCDEPATVHLIDTFADGEEAELSTGGGGTVCRADYCQAHADELGVG